VWNAADSETLLDHDMELGMRATAAPVYFADPPADDLTGVFCTIW
jgi:hypothetical protein